MVDREQDIRIWSLQERPGRSRPYLARWVVDGRTFSRGFRTRAQADRLRSRLMIAQQQGERFSTSTGEPKAWAPSPADQSVYEWARRWVAEEWTEWAPRSRDSEVEALARFIPLVVPKAAPVPPPEIRRHLNTELRPEVPWDWSGSATNPQAAEQWLGRWSVPLGHLDEILLSEADRLLGLKLDGTAAAPNTAKRYRRTARACIRRAVELKQLPADPWPPTPRGRSRRKARRQARAIDVKRLPDPATMRMVLELMTSHQPASQMYRTMTAVGYYAGLRPSETIMLRPSALTLPTDGWGQIQVLVADDGYDGAAEPKTGPRHVPIPPELVSWLRSWINQLDPTRDALLFRTRTGERPALSNWGRSLKRATKLAEIAPMSPYDCRHACATTWLRAGVPLGEAALRLGHSVETLVAYYIGALHGDDVVANERIARALGGAPART